MISGQSPPLPLPLPKLFPPAPRTLRPLLPCFLLLPSLYTYLYTYLSPSLPPTHTPHTPSPSLYTYIPQPSLFPSSISLLPPSQPLPPLALFFRSSLLSPPLSILASFPSPYPSLSSPPLHLTSSALGRPSVLVLLRHSSWKRQAKAVRCCRARGSSSKSSYPPARSQGLRQLRGQASPLLLPPPPLNSLPLHMSFGQVVLASDTGCYWQVVLPYFSQLIITRLP